jgi:hypothetical protein
MNSRGSRHVQDCESTLMALRVRPYKLLGVLFFLLCCSGPSTRALAASISLTLRTDPPGADVVLIGNRGQQVSLGPSGQAWEPSRSSMAEVASAIGTEAQASMRLSHAGYEDATITIPSTLLRGPQGIWPAPAQPPFKLQPMVRRIVFDTSPSGAVVQFTSGAARFSGHSGEPISIDFSQLLTPQGQFVAAIDGTFSLPGFVPRRATIRTMELAHLSRWPSDGPFTLNENLPGARLYYWCTTHRVWMLGMLLLTLVAGASGWRQWRRVRLELQQKARRDQFLSSADTSDPLIGKILSRWQLVGKLGQGGMGTVYRAVARDGLGDCEDVAIKVFSPEVAADEEFQKRFRREVKISKGLQHDAIVRLIDWGEQDGYVFIVMELVVGRTLRIHLNRALEQHAEGLPLDEAMALIEPLLSGVAYAHQQGIVHRDLKPDNVIITDQAQRVKIVDFGIARAGEQSTRITESSEVMGTIGYLAPERLRGIDTDPRSDQYSLGVILYELLCGKKPYNVDPTNMLSMHFQPTPLGEQRAALPVGLSEAVMRLLEREPQKRYADVNEALQSIRAALVAAGPRQRS